MLCQALRIFALAPGLAAAIQGMHVRPWPRLEEMAVGLCRKFAFLRPNVKIVC